MKNSVRIVFCTTATADEAKSIAKILVEKKLAACCSIIPNITSIYHWKDSIVEDNEWQIMIKTSDKKYNLVEKEIQMIHSYDIPEVISLNIDKGSQAYIDWVLATLES